MNTSTSRPRSATASWISFHGTSTRPATAIKDLQPCSQTPPLSPMGSRPQHWQVMDAVPGHPAPVPEQAPDPGGNGC